jgi:UDP-N-acetylglucosamine:LPS N-acetylglucosamine transferase
MLRRICHAPGVGVAAPILDREAARLRLGLPVDRDIVLVVAGGGGDGTPAPPLSLGARAEPDSLWITIGEVVRAWHDTPPSNLLHQGWVEDAATWIAAADRVVSSAGNTTVHMIAAIGRPWIVVPEWRYFAEQHWKAKMLHLTGAAVACDHWPASAGAWSEAWTKARRIDTDKQTILYDPLAAEHVAEWIEALINRCWGDLSPSVPTALPISTLIVEEIEQ